MITCNNVSKKYEGGHEVLRNISFKVGEGSFNILTGASGAGKTTLLNIISLAMLPSSGKISLFGHDVVGLDREVLPKIRRNIGFVRQDYQLLDHLTVAENVALPLKINGNKRAEIKRKVAEMLDWIGLEKFHHYKPSHLSGGEQQRVAIARAVINNPSLLIADEPSGSLDKELSKRLMYLFESLNKMGTTVIFATHDESLIKDFSHPVWHIEGGVIARG